EAGETRRGDAHYGHGVVVHQEFPPDDVPVGGETRHPIFVAQDDGGMAFVDAIVLLGREHPADGGAHAERLEVVAGYEFGVDSLGLTAEAEGNGGAEAAEHAGERLRLFLEILVHRVRRHARSAIASYVRPGGPDHDELFGLRHGQEAQHQLIDQGEDGGVGADAEGQRGHGDQGEQRAARQAAQGESEIEQKSGHALSVKYAVRGKRFAGNSRTGRGTLWVRLSFFARLEILGQARSISYVTGDIMKRRSWTGIDETL